MPILKEIDLDLPYVPDNEKLEKIMASEGITDILEAKRFDYSKNWKDKRIKFRDEVRCVCSLFEKKLGKVETKSTSKILINCYQEKGELTVIEDKVTTIDVRFDIDAYFESNPQEKKKMILDIIIAAIEFGSESLSLDLIHFKQVYHDISNHNIRNEYVVGKAKLSPNKKYKAEVLCIHEIDFFDTFVVFRDKNNKEVKREKVFRERPNEFAFVHLIGKLEWTTNDEIILWSKNKNENHKVYL